MLLSQLTCGKCNLIYFSFSGLSCGSRILYFARRLERALSCCLLLRHLLFHHLHHPFQSRFWLLFFSLTHRNLLQGCEPCSLGSCLLVASYSQSSLLCSLLRCCQGARPFPGPTNSSSSATQGNLFLVCLEYFPALRMVSSSSSFYCTLLQ